MKLLTTLFLTALSSYASGARLPRRHEHGGPFNHTRHEPAGHFTFDELWDLNQKFWTSFVYPNNVAQAKMINSTMFSEDIQGRVDLTRDFDGRELNTEYVYGLFANIAQSTNSFTLLGSPTNFTVTQFAANENIVATTVIVNFYHQLVQRNYPIEIVVWFTYNCKGQISQYDGTFLRFLDWQFADMYAVASKQLNITNPATLDTLFTDQLASSICLTHQTYCTGSLAQYASTSECVGFLTDGSVSLGAPYQLGMDTVACRSVHASMLSARPAIHCPHVGPSGGGYCTNDRDYTTYVNTNPYTNQPFVPYGKPGRT